jgi:MFS transporter, MHS family, proline/betaine transporter
MGYVSSMAAEAVAPNDRNSLTRAQWKMIILASLGGSLEFYDFIVYGVFAQYFAAAFFPLTDRLVSLILTFSVFAVGYFARPLGGIVLSHYGDKFGRRKVFIASLLVISASTFCIGLLPTYSSIGVAAPLLLILLRLTQGFCLGGELPGAITYVVEAAPHRAGLVCGIVFCFANSGVLLATMINLAVHSYLPPGDVASWGWRAAFMFGGVIGLISFWLQQSLEESPEFVKMKALASRRPFSEVIAHFRMPVILGITTTAVVGAFNGLLIAHMPAYLITLLHYPAKSVVAGQNVCMALESAGLIFTGWLGDLFPRRYLLQAGSILLALLAYPFYAALVNRSIGLMTLFVLAGIAATLANGTFSAIMADMFPTRVRFSGVALAFNVSFTAFSGTAPLIATSLIKTTGWIWAPALFMIACGVISFVASLFTPKYEGQIERHVASVRAGTSA